MIDTFSIRHYPRISWERISGLEVFAMSSGVISMLVHVRSTYCNLFILSSWCAIWRYLQTFLKTGNVCQQKVLSNPRRLISSFDVQFVLLAGSKNAVFCGRCCASNSTMAEPTSWRAFTSSLRCKKGIEGVISRPLFHHSRWSLSLQTRPFRSAASYAGPHLEQCYQVLPSDCWNTEPEHQPYHSKPLALTWTQLITNQHIWSSEPHCLWSHCRWTRSRCSLSLAFPQSWRSMATSELWQCPWAWGFEGFEDVFKGSQSDAQ